MDISAPMNDAIRTQLADALGSAFELGHELGNAGMSRVYRARDTRLQRDVVVKVLSPDLAEHLSVERFAREIMLTAGLQEPHIVPLLDAGQTASGLPYYTMPYVAGESLRARLDRAGSLSTSETIAVLKDIARALAFAHARGVVHRDIKPENILLSGGTAVVADFGIAKALSASERHLSNHSLTALGVSVGTPAYMAPEQAVADPTVDHRADLYTWGVVAYELLARRHPFAERTTYQALVAAHLTERPVSLALLAELPASVTEIVMRCLEKDPADRPRDANELLAALEIAGSWAVDAPRRIAERTFRLSETICRRLDRALLDPRMIGDAMHYLENDAPAGVLLFCLHGMGQEAGQFAPLLAATSHHAVAPTLYGFEPGTKRERVPLAVDAHLALLVELLRETVARVAPTRVVLVGYSSGADLALRLLAAAQTDMPHVDACLALGPNLSLATCFGSRVFARLEAGDPASILDDVKRLDSEAADFDEWLNLTAYLLHVLRKFRGDLRPLSTFAAGIVNPFLDGNDAFANWFRNAAVRTSVLRCVFEGSALCATLVRALRLRNLDDGVLGPRYDEASLSLEATADHLALIDSVERHVDAIVDAIASRPGNPSNVSSAPPPSVEIGSTRLP
ncbi:MAG: serine/threonine-protein kinase [bacterium]